MDATRDSIHLTSPVHYIVNGVCMGETPFKMVRPGAAQAQAKAPKSSRNVGVTLPPARRVLAGIAQVETVDGRGKARIGSSFFRLTPTAATALAF